MRNNNRSITWLVQGGDTLPSVRFRVIPFIKKASEFGWQVEKIRIPKTALQRISFYKDLRKSDIAIIQKRLLSSLELFCLRKKIRYLIYDFDDAVWTNQEENKKIKEGCNWKKFYKLCSKVDLIIAGNNYLAQSVPPNKKNKVIITPIDTHKYKFKKNSISNTFLKVGWMGTSSYLEYVKPIVYFLDKNLNNNIEIISDKSPDIDAKSVRFKKWNSKTEVSDLQRFDVGLMPLADNVYTRGKCGFKLLQYMACGVIPLASHVGFNSEIITHEVDGFLIKKEKDWLHYIQKLQSNPELVCKMREAAIKKVSTNFSLDKIAPIFFSAIEDLCAQSALSSNLRL